LNLEHSLLADEAVGFHTPRVSAASFRVRFGQLVPERRSLSCGAGMRIIHSFGLGKYCAIEILAMPWLHPKSD